MAGRVLEPLPTDIGGYEILEQLTVTEMASVYKARHAATGEVVAIKVAGAAVLRDPELRTRFDQEFTVTRGLDHPHLVRALRFGCEGEAPFMVLEYTGDSSLGSRLEREGRLVEAESVRLITQVGEALHYAHQHRIIHRDVKPDNILLTADGRAKLADLALAKDHEMESQLTRPGVGLGTPNFMAPEQFSDARNADWRCDVYSLGATLYAAVTGELPFRARGPLSVLKKKLANDLVPPRKLVADLSPWVESAIVRAVDVNPQARPASCLQFIEELSGKDYRDGATSPSANARPRDPARGSRSERRAVIRYPSGKNSSCRPLREEKAVRWQGTVQDVSADGIGLILTRRFEPRTVLSVEIAAGAQTPARRLLVRVVRVSRLAPRRWLVGCVFPTRLGEEEVQGLL